MLIAEHIATILLVTGALTAVPNLQFLFPTTALKLSRKVGIEEPARRRWIRHRLRDGVHALPLRLGLIRP